MRGNRRITYPRPPYPLNRGARLAGGAWQRRRRRAELPSWRAGGCGTVPRWRGAAVSPLVQRSWWTGRTGRVGPARERAGVAGGRERPHAVQVVPGGPGLVPGAERGAFGAFGEPATRAGPPPATAAADPSLRHRVPGEPILRVPPEEA